MSEYGAYDFRGILNMPLSRIRKLALRIAIREVRRMKQHADAVRVGTNADENEYQRFCNDIDESMRLDGQEAIMEEDGEFIDPKHFGTVNG